jgi:hypothetical protein
VILRIQILACICSRKHDDDDDDDDDNDDDDGDDGNDYNYDDECEYIEEQDDEIMIKTTILFYDIPVAEVMCNGRMDLRKLSEDMV